MPAGTAAGRAPARAALAGNPSDGYGGAVLALALPTFEASAEARSAAAPAAAPPCELVTATIRRFARTVKPAAAGTQVAWRTSIPCCVGLGGSSAIVIATIRALCGLHRVSLTCDRLAQLALAVEVEDLGIAAGLQDRLAQAYGGLTFMDFGQPALHCEQLDVAALPALLVAWRTDSAGTSDAVHRDLRARYDRGEPAVHDVMGTLARLARAARDALIEGDREGFARAVDATFDARRGLLALDPRHVAMIRAARDAGCAANYTGSGGAIAVVGRSPSELERAERALRAAGAEIIAPRYAAAP